jgi:hypothetical protein
MGLCTNISCSRAEYATYASFAGLCYGHTMENAGRNSNSISNKVAPPLAAVEPRLNPAWSSVVQTRCRHLLHWLEAGVQQRQVQECSAQSVGESCGSSSGSRQAAAAVPRGVSQHTAPAVQVGPLPDVPCRGTPPHHRWRTTAVPVLHEGLVRFRGHQLQAHQHHAATKQGTAWAQVPAAACPCCAVCYALCAVLTLGGRNRSSSGVRRPFIKSAGGGLQPIQQQQITKTWSVAAWQGAQQTAPGLERQHQN